MQTFLPYSDFKKSTSVLDWKRLGKQRSEAKQILTVIKNGGSWRNHPAVLMWVGHEESLKLYLKTMIEEWVDRGYNNTMDIPIISSENIIHPEWLGNELIHLSHRSKLLQKNKDFYSKFWDVPYIPYLWPVSSLNRKYNTGRLNILGLDSKKLNMKFFRTDENIRKILILNN